MGLDLETLSTNGNEVRAASALVVEKKRYPE
jgi:hypothetical protein